QVPASEIAAAHVQHLAFADQLFHRLPDFFPPRFPIDMVHLIEVDTVSLKSPQTFLAGSLDVEGRQARLIRPLAHAAEDLRRQYDFLAPSPALAEPAPHDPLRPPLPHFPAI